MSEKMSMISIIVPMYNSSRYIGECIKSILLQDYANFELLLIDDHSSDNTVDLCKKYLSDDRVKLFNNEKKGVSSARNLGISKSNGEYIAFIDSDDIITKKYLSTLYELSLSYPDYLAICGYFRFIDKIPKYDEDNVGKIKKKTSSELLTNIFYYHSSACACLFKSDLIKKYNILMTENASFNEDVYFTCKYLCICKGGMCLSNQLYGYRTNPSGIGANKKHSELTAKDVEHRSKGYCAFQDALMFAENNSPEKVQFIDIGYSFIAAEVVLTSARASIKEFELKKEIRRYLSVRYCLKFLKYGKNLYQKLLVLGIAFRPSLVKFVLDDLGLLKITHNRRA